MSALGVAASDGIAVISGTSRGVGRAAALAFAARGLVPVMIARPSAAQAETERLLLDQGRTFQTMACELTDRDALSQVAREVVAQWGAPRVVVHNAAVVHRRRLVETDDAAWDEQIEVNLGAPFRLTRALLPAMLSARSGRVLFVSSISAGVGTAQQAPYNASKAGLVALMRSLAEELRDTGLMTVALLPGSVDTEMLVGSGFAPRMSAQDVAQSLVHYGLDAPIAHNGGVLEMFGV